MPTTLQEEEVRIATAGVALDGTLSRPVNATGLVVFAHGSGSSRFSSRNRFVAEQLHQAGLATLLFDLLTMQENSVDELTREYRFDIGRLAQRLTGTVDWVAANCETAQLPVGLFGASTGAAAALVAAAQRPDLVGAVVSRGGRPDLAGEFLSQVQAPTLLIVGGLDIQVIELNRQAAEALAAEHRIEIVPGASHLFEEPGKLRVVSQLAADWFTTHLH